MTTISLLTTILNATGQDLRPCWACSQCCATLDPDMDLTIESLIRMVLLDDDDVLESRTLWSGRVLGRAAHLCPRGLDLEAVLLALREEGWRRGVVDAII